MLQTYFNSFKKGMIPNPKSETDFTSWGRFKGVGKMLKGEAKMGGEMIIRIFCWTENDMTFASIIQMDEESESKHKKAFELIEKSFTVKK